MFEFALCYYREDGTSQVLLSGTMHALYFPIFALKVGELQRFLPGLRLLTMDHIVTALTFEHRNVRLVGEPVALSDS